MRIVTVGNFEYGWDGSACDEEHIASTFEKMGHNVTRISRTSVALGLPEGLALPDFVLIAQWDNYPEDFIEKLRDKYKCLIIYWAFDYQADGQIWHEALVNGADLYLSKRFADSKYENWRWFSQDFAPMFLDKYEKPIEKDIDVLFTGTYLDWAHERTATLQAIDEKFDLHIYSVNPEEWKKAGFKNVHGPVMDEQLPELIARAKVNISIDHTQEAGYWSDRNAQIMACGGFVLFRYVPLSETVFKHYVGYFFSPESAVQQVGVWLENAERRNYIAEAGYIYARNNLMVQNRVMELFFILGSIIG